MNNEQPTPVNQHLSEYTVPAPTLGEYPDQQLGVYPKQELTEEISQSQPS